MSVRVRFWLITVAAVIGVLVTLSLGRWQLARAAQKEGLQLAIETQNQRQPLDQTSFLKLAAPNAEAQPDHGNQPSAQIEPGTQIKPIPEIHRNVTLSGQWAIQHTVFLDNRQMNAKPGFYVVTPLLLDNSKRAVLVQRGWVARNFTDRANVPLIDTPSGPVEVRGRIAPPPSKLYELGSVDAGVIRQNIDLVKFGAETGLALMPLSVVQVGSPKNSSSPSSNSTSVPSHDQSKELLRDWPVAALTADKNYGYAFQWFGLSALITSLYVWFQIGKRFNGKKSQAN